MKNLGKVLLTGMVIISLTQAGWAMAEKAAHQDGQHEKTSSSGPASNKMKHQGGGHKPHLFTEDWHDTLTADQKIKVDGMHVQLLKETAPIQAVIKRKKIELAVLATEDAADLKAIQGKIDEILALKRQKMQKRFAHIVEMRSILTTEQRLSYDMLIVGREARSRR